MKILSVSGLLFCLILPAVSTPQKATEESIAPPAELSNTEDHRRMLDLLGITELRRGANGSDKNAPNYANYDESKATPYPDLPELLVTKDGRKVTTPEMWWEVRRPEIVDLFDAEVYGRVPENTPSVKWETVETTRDTVSGKNVITRRMVGYVDNTSYPAITVEIDLSLTLPADSPGPVPVILEFGFLKPRAGSKPTAGKGASFGFGGIQPWQQQVIDKGWGYAVISPNSIQADNGGGLTQGIIGLCNKGHPRDLDDWGVLRAWAWGASRAMDYFETDPAVDAGHVGIEGVSRYGKAAIVTLAYDQRFAAGLIASSGKGGSALYRRNWGERLENIADPYAYHWVSGNYMKYAADPLGWDDLPVDTHMLVALCAPRITFLSGSTLEDGDGWVDTKGTFMAGAAAAPVFRLLGANDMGTTEYPPLGKPLVDGQLAFRQHTDGHTAGSNWGFFIDLCEKYGFPTPRQGSGNTDEPIARSPLSSIAMPLSGPALEWVRFDSFAYEGVDKFCETSAQESGEYCNPILAGFYPDPSICRVGRDYYLINSTFAYFPGIPIFHSRDLVNWNQIGHVIHRPGQLRYEGLGVSRGIFAPAITYHEGVFWVVCTMVGGGGNFLVTAGNPAGPWSDPVYFSFEGIDPSLFFDDDGRAWMVNNGAPEEAPIYNGHRAIWIQEFDPAAKKMIGPRKVIANGGVDISREPIWIEGPHLYKRNGWYYLCAAEGGTGPGHSQVIFRSRKADGPYTPWDKNPILTQRDLDPGVSGAVTCTGHADLEIGPDGKWWSVFLGVRPYENAFSPMGRETFLLPVLWTDDDWPVILPPGERVPLKGRAPNEAAHRLSASMPLNGTFTWMDSFDHDSVSPAWIMLREPTETWWKFDTASGFLELAARADTLSGTGNPSYLARRVQHARFTASAFLEVPLNPEVSAGLAVFQSEQNHYFLAVKREGGQTHIYLERVKGGQTERMGSKALPGDKIGLRVEADDALCAFKYRSEGGAWITLIDNADARMLTTEVAGGFVGATVGPHVRIDP